MQKTVLIHLMLITFHGYSQFRKLSCYEKRWAIAHPFAALKVKKITKACYIIYNQPSTKLQLDSFSNGGKLDAFRHVYFMAAYAQKIKIKKLKKRGIAHEKANYRQFLNGQKEESEVPDSLGSVMDLKNNELGLNTGTTHRKTNLDDLKHIVVSEIKSGKAFILKRNRDGKYLDCTGDEIDMAKYARAWQVPKCLIASDQ